MDRIAELSREEERADYRRYAKNGQDRGATLNEGEGVELAMRECHGDIC